MSTTRYRSAGSLSGRVTTEWRWTSVANPNPPWSSAIRDCLGTLVEMNDTPTPNFYKLQKEGQIINNEMSRVETSVSGFDAGWKIFKPSTGSGAECLGNWTMQRYGPPTHLALPDYSSLISEASTSARAMVVPPDVQGLVSLAELGKTLSMLRHPVHGLRDLIDRVGRGRRKTSANDIRKAAESSYLEMRYGWRPFLLEIEAIAEALVKEYSKRLTARARRTQEDSVTSSWTGTTSNMYIEFSQTTSRTVEVRCGLLYEHTLDLGGTWGMRLSDIPAAAWELVPYSFVLDWLVNTADLINALVPKAGVRTLACWTTVRETTISTRASGTVTYPDPLWTTQRSPNGVDKTTTKSVVRVPNVEPPSLVIKANSLRSVLSDLRGLDALALLTQRIR